MKKNKIFWILSVCLLTFCSCSSDKDDSLKFIKKIVESSEGGVSETTLFTYKRNQISSADGTQKRTDFTYTDGFITKTVTLNKVSQLLETVVYSYLEGNLVEVVSFGNYRIIYIHNPDKTVSYEKFTTVSPNQEVKEFHGILYLENENFIKDERIFDNTAAGVVAKHSVIFDYDAKRNPLYNILGYKKLLDYNEGISSNNSLMRTVTTNFSKDEQITSSASLYKSTFKYDSENYPTERVSETAVAGNGNVGYLKTQYFY